MCDICSPLLVFFFFFNDTATTEIYTLSLHDALPILPQQRAPQDPGEQTLELDALELADRGPAPDGGALAQTRRSEEHTSELQSRQYLVCRLLLEKKKKTI